MQVVIILPCVGSLLAEPLSTHKIKSELLPCQAEVREVLKQTFKYDPTIRKKAEEEGLLDEDVIRLDPLVISEQKVNPYLVRQLDHTRELLESAKPSFSNGIGKALSPNITVGVMPYDYKLLPSSQPTPNWKLLNIRF